MMERALAIRETMLGLESLEGAVTAMLVYALATSVLGWLTGLLASVLWSFYPLQLWLTKRPDSGHRKDRGSWWVSCTDAAGLCVLLRLRGLTV